MKLNRSILPLIVVLLLGAGLSRPAWATAPCPCPMLLTTPSGGVHDVPTNTRIFIPFYGDLKRQTLALQEAQGAAAVPFQVEPSGVSQLVWIVPESELKPHTDYELRAEWDQGERPEDEFVLRFRTGSGADSSPPAYDGVTVEGEVMQGSCEQHSAAVVRFEGLTDDVTPTHSLLVLITVVDRDGNTTRIINQGDASYIGGGFADCLDNYPMADTDQPYRATVSVMDWAGNESQPTASIEFHFEQGARGWDCSTVQTSPPGGFAQPAMGLLCLVVLIGLCLRSRSVIAN